MSVNGFDPHDHDRCRQKALAAVENTCVQKGLSLTPLRRRVLEILLTRHTAMGAYDVLEQLRVDGLGAQPPTAYRALDFLVSNEFAHRIERLNAFVACTHPGEHHAPCFLICRTCDAVAELPGRRAIDALNGAASDLGFCVDHVSIEAEGLCPACGPAA